MQPAPTFLTLRHSCVSVNIEMAGVKVSVVTEFPNAQAYIRFVANHPRRHYGTNDLHFINCSCYHRQPWLGTPRRRDLFLTVIEQVRLRYRFVVVGYVVMPDHIHLLERRLQYWLALSDVIGS